MEVRKNLELVEVQYENEGKKAVMTFLDKERKEIRTVNFNLQSYSDGKYVDDPEKAEKVAGWCKDYFGCGFKDLPSKVGTKHDIYVYEKFNSLWESQEITKFTPDMEGQVFQTKVKDVVVDEYFIRIRYDIDKKTYESKMSFGMFMEATKEWFVDPIKKEKQYKKFEEKFGVPVSNAQAIIGHTLMVEVRKAMGKYLYGDCKKFAKTKG